MGAGGDTIAEIIRKAMVTTLLDMSHDPIIKTSNPAQRTVKAATNEYRLSRYFVKTVDSKIKLEMFRCSL